MKIAVYGLGAIGGLMAARLAQAGYTVSAVARGQTLQAVRAQGLCLHALSGTGATGAAGSSGTTGAAGVAGAAGAAAPASSDRAHLQVNAEPVQVSLHAVSDQPADLGPQDLVIVAVKTTALPAIAQAIQPLLGPDTAILSAMNGIPWWFFDGLQGAPSGIHLETVDPGRQLAQALPAQRVIGCVTHLAATSAQPGHVQPVAGNSLIIGEPHGRSSERVQSVARALRDAGFDTAITDAIQREIWFKLWGNMTVNPVSAITGATGDRILDDAYVRNFMSRCMLEAARVGARIGLPIDADPEERHAVTRKLGAFRTSMLQDKLAGRPLELDALVAVVIEIAHKMGEDVPSIETLFGLARLQARGLNLYP